MTELSLILFRTVCRPGQKIHFFCPITLVSLSIYRTFVIARGLEELVLSTLQNGLSLCVRSPCGVGMGGFCGLDTLCEHVLDECQRVRRQLLVHNDGDNLCERDL